MPPERDLVCGQPEPVVVAGTGSEPIFSDALQTALRSSQIRLLCAEGAIVAYRCFAAGSACLLRMGGEDAIRRLLRLDRYGVTVYATAGTRFSEPRSRF